MSDDEVIAQLEEVYAQLPTIECRGLCWNSCGPISMSVAERRRIREAGVDIPLFTREASERWNNDEPLHCPALVDHRCSVHEIRPFICRAWGPARGEMACLHGCTRSPGPRLKHADMMALYMQTLRIGGDPDGGIPEGMEELMADPAVSELLARFANGERHLEPEIIAAVKVARHRLRPKEVDGVS